MKAAVFLFFFCALTLAISLGAAAPLLPLPGAAPTHFDLRQTHPQCIPPVRDAGSCDDAGLIEGLYDMSVASCLATGKPLDLSNAYVGACCTSCGSCGGASMPTIFGWLQNNGSVNATCLPRGPIKSCPTKCIDGSPVKPVRAQFLPVKEVAAIQHTISTVGPVLAYINAIPLETYMGGVLKCSGVKPSLDHVVSIIGWGIESGVPYWICTNSWGPDWGEEGYFRIERGIDACGIEISNFAVQLL